MSEVGHEPASTDALRRAALHGATDARLALAKRLLSEEPYDVFERVKWARAAADDGNGEAAHLLATATAEGLGAPQDWQRVLDHLQRAAELGHRPAQGALAILAGAPANATDYKALRDAIDIGGWLGGPPIRQVFASPRIAVIEKFLSPAVCDWLMDAARPTLVRAQTYDPHTGGGRYTDGRSNTQSTRNIAQVDMVLTFVRARIAAITGLSILGFEDTSILHYEVGQEFLPHYDFIDGSGAGYLRELQFAGQRGVTVLAYLNDDYDGGETSFLQLDWKHKGRKGDAMLFYNAGADGTPDRRTLHAGLPTTRGEKWLLSQWIRVRPG